MIESLPNKFDNLFIFSKFNDLFKKYYNASLRTHTTNKTTFTFFSNVFLKDI